MDRFAVDAAVRAEILGFRERATAGGAEEQAILEMRTEDDTMRLLSVILSWQRYSNMLQLYTNRILRDPWLERRNKRSFRPWRDLTYIY